MPSPVRLQQPSPGKPIPSFPTPNVSDVIYEEVVDAWQGRYTPLAYGTAYNDVEHGSYPLDLPDHVLVYDGKVDISGQLRKRLWVSNRVDEDDYNYSIEYSGTKFYPAYLRTYVVKRSEYTPLADLTADPDHPGAYLVEEKLINQVEPQELAGQYVKVVRRYETLPGPLMHKVDYDNNQATYPIVTTTQRVKLSSYTPGTEGTTLCILPGYESLILFEQHLNPTENVNVKEDVRLFEKTPNNVVTTQSFDPELNALVTTTRQKIVAGATPTVGDLVLDLRESPLDKWRTLQVISSLSSLPASKTEYKTGQYAFPVLLTGITLLVSQLNDVVIDGTTFQRREVSWTPSELRQVNNLPALFKVTTSFHNESALPTISIFTLPTQDIIFNGISFQISIQNVLNDLITLSADMGPGTATDGRYGNLVETVTFQPTDISATQYTSTYVNTYQVIGVEQTRYRGKIWVQQLTEVLLQ